MDIHIIVIGIVFFGATIVYAHNPIWICLPILAIQAPIVTRSGDVGIGKRLVYILINEGLVVILSILSIVTLLILGK
jgi:hypothetical protein